MQKWPKPLGLVSTGSVGIEEGQVMLVLGPGEGARLIPG